MHHNQPPSQNRDPFLLQVQGIKEDIYICVKASYTYIMIKTTKQFICIMVKTIRHPLEHNKISQHI